MQNISSEKIDRIPKAYAASRHGILYFVKYSLHKSPSVVFLHIISSSPGSLSLYSNEYSFLI